MKILLNALLSLWVLPNNIVALIFLLYLLQTDSVKLKKVKDIDCYWEIDENSKIFSFLRRKRNRLAAFVIGTNVFLLVKENNLLYKTYIKHENVHVLQNKIFGIFMYPLYGLFWLCIKIFLSKDPYRDNPLERWARRVSGEPL